MGGTELSHVNLYSIKAVSGDLEICVSWPFSSLGTIHTAHGLFLLGCLSATLSCGAGLHSPRQLLFIEAYYLPVSTKEKAKL